MNNERFFNVAFRLRLSDGFYYMFRFQCFGERPCNDFPREQIHDTGEIDEPLICPYIGNVGASCCIGSLWIELLVENVVQFFARVGVKRCPRPRSYPLRFYAHFPHIFAYSTLTDTDIRLIEFAGDFTCSVVLVRLVVNLLDLLFNGFPARLRGRGGEDRYPERETPNLFSTPETENGRFAILAASVFAASSV